MGILGLMKPTYSVQDAFLMVKNRDLPISEFEAFAKAATNEKKLYKELEWRLMQGMIKTKAGLYIKNTLAKMGIDYKLPNDVDPTEAPKN